MTRTIITATTYKTYSFKDKDPVIDQLRTFVQASGKSYKEISANTRVSVSTLHNWFSGGTRRPQSATIEAVGRALGYERKWSKMTGGKK